MKIAALKLPVLLLKWLQNVCQIKLLLTIAHSYCHFTANADHFFFHCLSMIREGLWISCPRKKEFWAKKTWTNTEHLMWRKMMASVQKFARKMQERCTYVLKSRLPVLEDDVHKILVDQSLWDFVLAERGVTKVKLIYLILLWWNVEGKKIKNRK